jgi:hypothetical protein
MEADPLYPRTLPALAAALACILLFPACHTRAHLISAPILDRDLQITPDEMSRTFFDLDRYKEITFPFFAFFEMPTVRELEDTCYFGPPVSKSFSWWNFCPFFAFPLPFCPCKNMVWERGDYRIEAVVAYPFIFGFLPHIWYWDVEWIPPGYNPDEIQVFALTE